MRELLSAAWMILLAMSVAMSIAWFVQRRSGNSGWIDVIWSFSVGAVGVASALAPADQAQSWRQWLVALLVGFWSARLALHIVKRSRGVADDPRYAKMIRDWGESANARLWLMLQAQAVVGAVLALSILLAARAPEPSVRVLDVLGGLLLLVAVVGEAIADNQLKRFVANHANKNKVCDVGLWGLTRHPNYVFEWLVWFAMAIIAASSPASYPLGLIALAAPLLMYYVLRHVSGVPPLEEHMLSTRGDRYRVYQRSTPVFFPTLNSLQEALR